MKQLFVKAIKSASLLTMLSVFLRVGSGLITLPLALRVLTAAELGLYYTFIGFSSLVSLLDFGFSHTVSRSAAFAMGGAREFQTSGVPESNGTGEPNWTLLGELISAVKIWYHGAGIVLLLVMLIPGSYFLAPMIEKSGLPMSNLACWWFFAAVSAYSFVTTYWPGLLFGIGSVRAAAKIGIVAQSAGLVLLVTGLFCHWGLWSYGISALVAAFIGRIMTKHAFSVEAGLALSAPVDRTKRNVVLSRIWPMAWRQGVVLLGAFLIQRGNTLVCSSKLGLVETGSYGLSLNILNLLFQVVVIPLGLAWPIIGRLRVDRNFGEIRRIFMIRLYGGLLVASVSIVGLAYWGSPMLELIGAKTTLLPTPVFLLLGAVLWLENHHAQYGSLVLTENENPFVWPAILSGVAIFLISWQTASHWGVLGLIAAQGLVQLSFNNWWPVLRAFKGLKSVERETLTDSEPFLAVPK